MRESFYHAGLLLFLLVLVSFTDATFRHMTKKQGKEARLDEILSLPQIDEMDSSDYLMGKEDCGEGDEVCIKGRIISEAHLDYIYTQHDRP